MATHNPNTTAFVFVGGVNHNPIFFERLVQELVSRGFDPTAVAYPTIGLNNVGKTQRDEIKAIQDAVARYANDDTNSKDVVLVGHSYGGWPASRAVKGWDRQSRLGKRGIKEIVFLAAFLLPEDTDMATSSYLPPLLTVRVRIDSSTHIALSIDIEQDGLEKGERKLNESCIPLLFSDLPEDQRRYWFGKLEWQRNAFHGDTVPDAPWHLKELSKTYILLTEDAMASLDFQLDMLKAVIDESWAVRSLKSGHDPMLSKPRELAEVLLLPRY